MDQGGITNRVAQTPQRQQKNACEQSYKSAPFHSSSSMMRAWKVEILVPGHFQASLARPALTQVWDKKVSMSQPHCVATWGSNTPRSFPLAMWSPCLPTSRASGLETDSNGERTEMSMRISGSSPLLIGVTR